MRATPVWHVNLPSQRYIPTSNGFGLNWLDSISRIHDVWSPEHRIVSLETFFFGIYQPHPRGVASSNAAPRTSALCLYLIRWALNVSKMVERLTKLTNNQSMTPVLPDISRRPRRCGAIPAALRLEARQTISIKMRSRLPGIYGK